MGYWAVISYGAVSVSRYHPWTDSDTGFSRVELQFEPKISKPASLADTTDFSRVEFQLRPNKNRLAAR